MRDPCECKAELGGIARIRIVEVSFVSLLSLSGMEGGGQYGICVNGKLNLVIFCVDQCGKCVIFL